MGARPKVPVEFTVDLDEGDQSLNFRIGDDEQPLQVNYQPRTGKSKRTTTTRKRLQKPDHDTSLRLRLPGGVKISNGNDVQILVEDEGQSRAVHQGIGSLQRAAFKIEEGAKLFVDMLKNTGNIVDSLRMREEKDLVVSRLAREVRQLKDEVEELRRCRVSPRSDEFGNLRSRMNELSESLRKATQKLATVHKGAEGGRERLGSSQDTWTSELVGFQTAGKKKDIRNTVMRLHAIVKANKKLIRQMCSKEMDVIHIQKAYIDKAESLLAEQDLLLKKLFREIDGECSMANSDAHPLSGDAHPLSTEAELLRTMESMAEKMQVQQDATEALRDAVTMLKNKSIDEESTQILPRKSFDARKVSVQEARDREMTVLEGISRTYPKFKAEVSRSFRDRNESLARHLKNKEDQFNFLYNALEEQYKKLDDYVQAMIIGAPQEAMHERIVEIREYLRLLLRLAHEPDPEQRQAELVAAKLMQHVFPEGGGWPHTLADLSRNRALEESRIGDPISSSTPIRGVKKTDGSQEFVTAASFSSPKSQLMSQNRGLDSSTKNFNRFMQRSDNRFQPITSGYHADVSASRLQQSMQSREGDISSRQIQPLTPRHESETSPARFQPLVAVNEETGRSSGQQFQPMTPRRESEIPPAQFRPLTTRNETDAFQAMRPHRRGDVPSTFFNSPSTDPATRNETDASYSNDQSNGAFQAMRALRRGDVPSTFFNSPSTNPALGGSYLDQTQ